MQKKRYRRPILKEGELRMYYGRLPYDSPDIIYVWQGEPSMKRDSRFLHYYLGSKRPDPSALPLWSKMEPSFIEELEARGYDITTLKFSIIKKDSKNSHK